MKCTTVKDGYPCFFMKKNGCQFNGGTCHPVIEECEGCEKMTDLPSGKYCHSFPDPPVKWRLGKCNMATHLNTSSRGAVEKLNPLKASKRTAH